MWWRQGLHKRLRALAALADGALIDEIASIAVVAERFEPLLASAVRIQPGDLAALRDLGAVGTLWLEGVVDRRF